MNNRELASSGQVCSCRGRRRGATLVEFAVVAPIVFLFFFASIELSRMQMLRNAADDAAYEAARTAIIPGGTADEAIAVANRYTNGLALRGVTVTVDPATVTDTTEAVEV
ncbi:MAG: Flp pilus assembly protein TadG, partial [Pirellulaceae bacterium]